MIVTERLNLRAIEKTDAESYHKWINDSETNFWRGLYHPISLTESEASMSSLAQLSSSSITLVIDQKKSNPIGLIGLRSICHRSRRAEIWIYIGDKNSWNKKYGQEAMSSIIKYAFEEMNLHRIWLECDPDFIQSVKCYERVGFITEGRLKDGYYRHGKYRDTIIMGLVSER